MWEHPSRHDRKECVEWERAAPDIHSCNVESIDLLEKLVSSFIPACHDITTSSTDARKFHRENLIVMNVGRELPRTAHFGE